MRVDLKSMLFGSALIFALFIILGQTNKPSEQIGRYQIVMPYTDFFNPVLWDTQIGKTYQLDRETGTWVEVEKKMDKIDFYLAKIEKARKNKEPFPRIWIELLIRITSPSITEDSLQEELQKEEKAWNEKLKDLK